uniref:Glycosyltransferase family 92 protein n=1 Tax=Caenorhabditis tropicalis TaxID=1561998 RepID=A0A1I7UNS9_9PELO
MTEGHATATAIAITSNLPNWALLDEISVPLLETGVGTLPVLQAALPSILSITQDDDNINERYWKVLRIAQLQIEHLLFLDENEEISEILKPVDVKSDEQITTGSPSKLKSKSDGVISQSVLIGYSNADKLTIFSSFTGSFGTTVILSSYGYLNRRVYCRLFDGNKQEIYQKAVSVFPEFTIKCAESPSIKPEFVAVTINKKEVPENLKRISMRKTNQKKSELTVCLAPLFGESPKVLMLIEFFEYYKLQGVDSFLIYSFDISNDTENLLEYYGKSSENIEVIRIGNETKCLNQHRCRHEMQLQDCVFRSQNKAKWVATVDLDERIMPIDEKLTILDFIRTFDNSLISELRFRCQWTIRYAEISSGPPEIDDLPMIKWHNTSHVAPQNHTTKSIIRPQNVDSMGVHGVQKFRNPKFVVQLVEPEDAVVRHYRLIKGWNFFLKEAESFGEFFEFTLSSGLSNSIVERVVKVITKFPISTVK